MFHKHQHIVNLVEILTLHKVEDIIISPGSRNAPLTNAFYEKFGSSCTSIVDERSAAYYALGKSLKTRKPTILVCTSGTAALNYAPALAEAYYQGVPLIAITADRPPELIGHQDNQTIHQTNLYQENIKGSYNFPTDILTTSLLKECEKIINIAYLLSLSGFPGPVHINIPLREPLFGALPDETSNLTFYNLPGQDKTKPLNNDLFDSWNNAKSIYIICGQHSPDKELKDSIARISKDKRVVIFAEAISNIIDGATIHSPDVVINFKDRKLSKFPQTLVLYYGGHIVSKKLKNFLQEHEHAEFYFIENSDREIDTFQLIKKAIKDRPANVFGKLPLQEGEPNEFKSYWKNKNKECIAKGKKHLNGIPYSDLKVFEKISELLPPDATIFSGNSSAIRYLQYFHQKDRVLYANRGTSGIDGSLSSAAGLASKANKEVFAILGDLSFLYDSNALWNREFPMNLKIMVVNNKGGGIFHLIPGPSENESFQPFFNAHHPAKIKKIAEAFNFDYIHCNNLKKLKKCIQQISGNNVNRVILEIVTPNNGEAGITRDFFNYLKS